MNVSEAIRARRSVRNYDPRPVEDEKLARVLEAGRLAPSARNLQEWRFIVVRDPDMRRRLSEAAKGQAFVAQAPVVIVACGTQADYVMTCGQHAYSVDVTIAVDHMTLQAVEEGLGTCWLGAFYEDQVKAALDIPEDVRVVTMFPLGYPADQPASDARPRAALDEIVMQGKWDPARG